MALASFSFWPLDPPWANSYSGTHQKSQKLSMTTGVRCREGTRLGRAFGAVRDGLTRDLAELERDGISRLREEGSGTRCDGKMKRGVAGRDRGSLHFERRRYARSLSTQF